MGKAHEVVMKVTLDGDGLTVVDFTVSKELEPFFVDVARLLEMVAQDIRKNRFQTSLTQ